MKHLLIFMVLFAASAQAGPVVHWLEPRDSATPLMPHEYQPMPLLEVEEQEEAARGQSSPTQFVGPRGYIQGQPPSEDNRIWHPAPVTHGEARVLESPFFTRPDPDDAAAFPPFQRWTWYGRYLTYPTSTIGKLFFRMDMNGDGNVISFVCSAAVIGPNTVATAAHCLHNGRWNNVERGIANDGWAFDVRFCPSFNLGGINPRRGCWSAEIAVVASLWIDAGVTSRDYGCIVMDPQGGVNQRPVGFETGWLGRAWNWPSRQLVHAWGYPRGGPFNGRHIITATSMEWYERFGDSREPWQGTKYMGNDMTRGSSGGPWWLNTSHADNSFEVEDIDGSTITNPGQGRPTPLLNGINSHRRNQVFREMGSAQFLNTDEDDEESEDIFKTCLGM